MLNKTSKVERATKQTDDFGQANFLTLINVVSQYFEGLHHGDTEKLAKIFHPDAVLKTPGLRRPLNDWLAAIEERPKPAQQGTGFHYRLLAIEITGEQAMVKVACPLFEHHYVDYLGLLNENGQWRIVNKMYADQV